MKFTERFDKVMGAVSDVLHTIANRLTPIESDMADSAASQEALANAMLSIEDKVSKLTELTLEQGDKLDQVIAMFQNYLTATREKQRAADQAITEAKALESEIRKKLG